ncbi:hypothetical protein [Streptomyces sp. NPDC050263]|uniref:hypothetical protein n=1 Tax=Streptomyces sp. NPDC050263 TaxID=3155037 RepID=UPI00342271A7
MQSTVAAATGQPPAKPARSYSSVHWRTISEALAAELVETMLRSGAVVLRDGRLHASAAYGPVVAESLGVPFPRGWPATGPAGAGAPTPK